MKELLIAILFMVALILIVVCIILLLEGLRIRAERIAQRKLDKETEEITL